MYTNCVLCILCYTNCVNVQKCTLVYTQTTQRKTILRPSFAKIDFTQYTQLCCLCICKNEGTPHTSEM